jgi:hypothetical protein
MRDPVNLHIPQYFHVFSTREIHPGYGDRAANGSKPARNDIAFRLWICKDADESAHAEAEDRKLRKDPSWRSLL